MQPALGRFRSVFRRPFSQPMRPIDIDVVKWTVKRGFLYPYSGSGLNLLLNDWDLKLKIEDGELQPLDRKRREEAVCEFPACTERVAMLTRAIAEAPRTHRSHLLTDLWSQAHAARLEFDAALQRLLLPDIL
jgi:hypothetical protein